MENLSNIMMIEDVFIAQSSITEKCAIFLIKENEDSLKKCLFFINKFTEIEKYETLINYNYCECVRIEISSDVYKECLCIIEKIKINKIIESQENQSSKRKRL